VEKGKESCAVMPLTRRQCTIHRESSSDVSNPGFPEPETRFFWLFSTTRKPFFSTTKTGYFKKTWIAVAFKYF